MEARNSNSSGLIEFFDQIYHFYSKFFIIRFRYKLDNGEIHDGEVFHVNGNIYLMFGANDILYSIEIGEKEINKIEFTKVAHIGKSIQKEKNSNQNSE